MKNDSYRTNLFSYNLIRYQTIYKMLIIMRVWIKMSKNKSHTSPSLLKTQAQDDQRDLVQLHRFRQNLQHAWNKRWKAAHGRNLMCVTGYRMSNIFSHVFKISKWQHSYDISLHLLVVYINKFVYLFLKCKYLTSFSCI